MLSPTQHAPDDGDDREVYRLPARIAHAPARALMREDGPAKLSPMSERAAAHPSDAASNKRAHGSRTAWKRVAGENGDSLAFALVAVVPSTPVTTCRRCARGVLPPRVMCPACARRESSRLPGPRGWGRRQSALATALAALDEAEARARWTELAAVYEYLPPPLRRLVDDCKAQACREAAAHVESDPATRERRQATALRRFAATLAPALRTEIKRRQRDGDG